MSKLANRISTTAKDTGAIIVVYGPPGSGKTTMFSHAPDVLMVQIKDESVDVLKAHGQVGENLPATTVKDYQDMLDLLEALRTEKHDFKFVVLDGMSGMNDFTDAYTVDVDCKGDFTDFVAFGRGEKLAVFHWWPVLEAVKALKEERGIKVVILAHKEAVTVKNPDGTDYLINRPGMGKEKFAATNKYVDAILLVDYIVEVKDPNKANAAIKVAGKAVGGSQRIMYTAGKASFEAKNRLGLPAEILLGRNSQESWNLFVAALRGE